MAARNIHLIRQDIHSTTRLSDFESNSFKDELQSLFLELPTGNSQNFHAYVHAIQEYNKKLYTLGINRQVFEKTDAGFRPISFEDFFGESSENLQFPFTFPLTFS